MSVGKMVHVRARGMTGASIGDCKAAIITEVKKATQGILRVTIFDHVDTQVGITCCPEDVKDNSIGYFGHSWHEAETCNH